jgi:nicotinate-nucleotide adenylyltransferase
MRYGIFGGAFDPIHLGHLLLAETALRQAELDRVIFVPTGLSPHRSGKEAYHASPEDRFQMIEAAIMGCEEFLVSRYEVDHHEPSFTVETLRYFKKAFALTQPELFLILGADMFNDLPNWREAGEICRLATPLVACRPDTSLPYFEGLSGFISRERYEEIHRFSLQMPQLEISSTAIRVAVAAEKSIRFQVPRSVDSYIQRHGLYRRIVKE